VEVSLRALNVVLHKIAKALQDGYDFIDLLGFISFSVMKAHLDKPEKVDKVVSVLQGFRNFMQYHIKCSKAHFHSRMRARVVSLLGVLNRAKPDIDPRMLQARTISGKTFTRKG